MGGTTFSKKIIGEHYGEEVRAEEVVIVNVDLSYVQDGRSFYSEKNETDENGF